jgi:hypothetical protein
MKLAEIHHMLLVCFRKKAAFSFPEKESVLILEIVAKSSVEVEELIIFRQHFANF